MKNPLLTFVSIVLLILALLVFILFLGGDLDMTGLFLLVMAPIIGPVSVLIEPVNSLVFKLIYFIVLVVLATLVVFGLKKRSYLWGKGIIFFSILGWFYCAMLGLSA